MIKKFIYQNDTIIYPQIPHIEYHDSGVYELSKSRVFKHRYYLKDVGS
ncbi:hypothetical protein [Riemerella columbina]|nr:hypothetical protein [Riemerella columbina]